MNDKECFTVLLLAMAGCPEPVWVKSTSIRRFGETLSSMAVVRSHMHEAAMRV